MDVQGFPARNLRRAAASQMDGKWILDGASFKKTGEAHVSVLLQGYGPVVVRVVHVE